MNYSFKRQAADLFLFKRTKLKRSVLYATAFIVMMLAGCGTGSSSPDGGGDTIVTDTGKTPTDSSIATSFEDTTLPNDIEAIQTRYANIAAAKTKGVLQKREVSFNCHNEQVGKLMFYSSNGRIVLVEKSYGELSHRDVTEQYFLAGGRPFFIFSKTTDWVFDSEAGVDGATRDTTTEQRFYIGGGRDVIRCLQKTYTTRSAADNNPDPEVVPNKEVTCPEARVLIDRTNALLKYSASKGNIGCIE